MIRLLDWPRMGGETPHRGGERQTVKTPSASDLFTAPAALRRGSATWLFAADDGGTAAWTLSDGQLTPLWRNGIAGRAQLTVLPDELDAALLLLDPPEAAAPTRWAAIARALVADVHSRVSTAASRRRAAWMLVLLGRRWGAFPDSDAYARLLQGEPERRPLATVLEADALARGGRLTAALVMTDSLTPLSADSLGEPDVVDPFFRTVLHLFRAAWHERRHDPDGEERELQWYQNSDVSGWPSGPPQVGDIDWRFSTLARWRLATLLNEAGDRRACGFYSRVADAWSHGDARYRARADSAAARVTMLHCRQGS